MAAYDMHGMVEFAEPVPFRLTRNLQTFFTPFGVEGLFISSMCAAAQAVVAPKVSFLLLIASRLQLFLIELRHFWRWIAS